ncbi:hypothetical protein KUTeg_012981 [Tegillarca granosa]|uniref:Uncharacterized protein n=1 Tax=Tegillarca granosa TaxID=220873 RepID=A0ABQ9ESC4_TEGGR|nr:hypothetical protein KUTeg_012981 [Tegillarca granosa]
MKTKSVPMQQVRHVKDSACDMKLVSVVNCCLRETGESFGNTKSPHIVSIDFAGINPLDFIAVVAENNFLKMEMAKNSIENLDLQRKLKTSEETCNSLSKLINPQLLQALQPTVGDKWTLEVEEAWSTFLKIVTFTMKKPCYLDLS